MVWSEESKKVAMNDWFVQYYWKVGFNRKNMIYVYQKGKTKYIYMNESNKSPWAIAHTLS